MNFLKTLSFHSLSALGIILFSQNTYAHYSSPNGPLRVPPACVCAARCDGEQILTGGVSSMCGLYSYTCPDGTVVSQYGVNCGSNVQITFGNDGINYNIDLNEGSKLNDLDLQQLEK